MKKVLFILMLLPFITKAQVYQVLPQYGYQMQRGQIDSVLKIPADTVRNKTGIARIGITLYAGNGTYWSAAGGTAGWLLTGNASTTPGTNFIGTTDNVRFDIRTNNTIRQTTTETGNVGIGITAPTAKLHVYTDALSYAKLGGSVQQIVADDSILLSANNNNLRLNSGSSIVLNAAANDVNIPSGFNAGTGNTITGDLIIGSNLYFNQAGYLNRVGLGTGTPSQKLHVIGGAKADSVITPELRSPLGTDLNIDGGNNLTLNSLNGSIDLYSNGTNDITLNSNKDVVISPASNLRFSSLPSGVGTKSIRYNPATGIVTYADTTTAASYLAGYGMGLTGSTFRVDSSVIATLGSTQVFTGVKWWTANQINTANGAASTPAIRLSGTWFKGGSATTTKPQLLIEPTGTTSTAWSTSGTALGINSATGFAGSAIEIQQNGASKLTISYNGVIDGQGAISTTGMITGNLGIQTNTGGNGFKFNSGGFFICPSAGVFKFTDNTDASFGRLQLGGTTTSFPAIARNGTGIDIKLADNSAYTTVRASQFVATTSVFWSAGSGSPEGVLTANIGSLYSRTDGGAGTSLYVKESGTGNTGWVAK